MSHTKGKWEFRLPDGMAAINNDGGVAVVALPESDDDDRKLVATIACQTEFKRGNGWKTVCEERNANARLIAASPRMLDALKAIVAVCDESRLTSPEIVAAIDAIAYAES